MIRHIRGRIEHEGIEASVTSGPNQQIAVKAVNGNAFTSRQCRTIALIASLNGLTYAGGEQVNSSESYWSDHDGVSQFTFLDRRTRS
jgi:hypothetical protein